MISSDFVQKTAIKAIQMIYVKLVAPVEVIFRLEKIKKTTSL